jgi:hypothetical protein
MRTARRFARIGFGIAVLSGAVLGLGTLPGSATTTGTEHGAVLQGQSQSLALEHSAAAFFQCDSASGVWSVKAGSIQVIASDHVTAWDTSNGPVPNRYWIEVDINHAVFVRTPLSQAGSGLFTGSITYLMPNRATNCATGAAIEVRGGAFLDSLNSLDLVGTQS